MMLSRCLRSARQCSVLPRAASRMRTGVKPVLPSTSNVRFLSAASIGTSSLFVSGRRRATTSHKRSVVGLPSGVRRLHIHEHQAMDLFRNNNISVPDGKVASTPEEAEQIAHELAKKGIKDFIVKAQILAGGRGRGTFANGFMGGVHSCTSPQQVASVAKKMLGQRLVTAQTGPEGKTVREVLVVERSFLRRETYFAVLMDRQNQGPVLMASSQGGMDIEMVAKNSPELVLTEAVDVEKGLIHEQATRMAEAVGWEGDSIEPAAKLYENIYKFFCKYDCTQVEINPLAETSTGLPICVDAKLNFDPNALYRQPELQTKRDTTQQDAREVQAEDAGLTYIGLDGNIGCLVNGAGLAMATMDIIKFYGGEPANFLDLGGGATEKQVTEAFKLLNTDNSVRAILVNIFGGIMRCDVIALGIIKAAAEIGLRKPMVVRLAGTKVDEAQKLLEDSGLRVLTTTDLADAAEKVVRITDILKMAESAKVSVNFELPL